MKKISYIIIISIPLLTSSCKSQNKCEKLKNKEISLVYISENKKKFVEELNMLMLCFYDSVDLQIFNGPNGNNFEEWAKILDLADLSKAPEEQITYNFFLVLFNKLKTTNEYNNTRKVVVALNKLSNKKANISNWANDSLLLREMAYTNYDIKKIKEIVSQNTDENRIYYDVLQELATINQESEIVYEETNKPNCNTPSYSNYFHMPHSLKAYFEYSEGLECSKKSNKPIFLYFTGHGSIESREFEAYILSDREILQILKQEYIIINLYSDDKSSAKSDHFVFLKQNNDTLRLFREINQYYQEKLFNENIQPAVYILNSSGAEICEPYNFKTSSVEKLKKYLKEGIENFRE